MEVKEIVKKYLEDNGYGGLYDGEECGCEVEDLAPCGEMPDTCIAGYKIPCPRIADPDGEHSCECIPDYQNEAWHITPIKPKEQSDE